MTSRAFDRFETQKHSSGLGGNARNGWGRYPDRNPKPPMTPMELLELRRTQRGQSIL